MKTKNLWWKLYLIVLLLISMTTAAYFSWKKCVLPVDKNSMSYENGSLYGVENTGKNTYNLYKADMEGRIYDLIEWVLPYQSGSRLEVSHVPGYDDADLYMVQETDGKGSSYQLYKWDHESERMLLFLDMRNVIDAGTPLARTAGDGDVMAYETRERLDSGTSKFSFFHIGEGGQSVFDGSIRTGTYSIQDADFFAPYGWVIVDGYGNCFRFQEGKTENIFENDGSRFTTHNVMISLGEDYVVMRNLDDERDLCILYDDPDTVLTYPYSKSIEIAGTAYEDEIFIGTQRGADGSILYGFVETDDGNTVFYQAEQNEETVLRQIIYPYHYMIKKALPIFLLCLLIGVLTGIMIWVWIYVYQRRLSLYVKILAIMLLSILVITNMVYKQNYSRISREIIDDETQNLYGDAQYQIAQMDLDVLSQIADTYQVLPEDIRKQLFRASNVTLPTDLYDINNQSDGTLASRQKFYPEYFLCRGDDIYNLNYDGVANVQYQYQQPKLVVQAVRKAVAEKTMVSIVRYSDTQWVRSLVVPIRKNDGSILGAIQVLVREDSVQQKIQSATEDLRRYQSLWYGVLLLILVVALYIFLRPLKILTKMAEKLGRGNLDVRMKVKGNDEISEIASVFNQMAEGVGKHLTELQRYTDAYAKFIPNATFQAMGKENITELSLMSEANMQAVILAMATNLYEEMLPYVSIRNLYVFDFMNDALRIQIPAIARYGGHAGSFADAGAVAYFADNPEAALKAAIDAVDALNKNDLCLENKKASFQAAIGFGMMHMGVVGTAKRMTIQNISEEENLVKFLRRIAEEYGAEILILEEATRQIPDFSAHYRARTFGYVRLSADQSLRLVYEVFDTNTAKMRLGKEQTTAIYEKGIRLFWEGKAAEARNCFVQLLRINKFDKAAQKYFYLCDRYMNEQKTDYDCWVEEY